MGFQGSVESFSLADVFQNLAMNQQTGTLRVFVAGGHERHIYFESGQVKFLSHGTQKPLLLGEILVGRGVANEDQVAQALARQAEVREPLGACMVALTFMTQEQVDEIVRHQIEEEIYDLFGWEKAQFEFTDGPPAPGLFVDQAAGKGPKLPISHLIMEAARRVDEWDKLRQQVPSFREIYKVDDHIVEAVAKGQLETDLIEKRVLSLIDGTRDVDDLIQDSFLFRFEVLSAVSGFLQGSMVRPAKPEELSSAAEQLAADGNQTRRCKVLERLLAVGGDNPEVRKALAEALAAEGLSDKAAIHFSVLADEEMKKGSEDGAIQLYRRILQILPQHLPSRDRLGAIYARRGQKREAVIQYQELIHSYTNNKQFPEARAACTKALECEPLNTELRNELIQVYLAEGDRGNAAREHEVLGDQLAKQGQSKAAADNYRKAMQCQPALSHLKKKLASVMLTEEDRRARTKRTLIVGAVAAGLLLVAAAIGVREFDNWQTLKRLQTQGVQYTAEAQMLESKRRYQEAGQKYQDIIVIFRNSGLSERWSPFVKANRSAQDAMDRFENLKNVADQNFQRMKSGGQQNSRADLEEALRLQREDNVYAASEAFDKVLNNEFATDEDRENAKQHKGLLLKRIEEFEKGAERLKQAPKEAFKDVIEEYSFKEGFLRNFQRIPQLPPDIQKPVKFSTDTNGVQVFLDGKFVNTANKDAENIFRYADTGKARKFEFKKKGYRTLSMSTLGLGPTAKVRLDREPAAFLELEMLACGSPFSDGKNLWVGNSEGAMVQVDGEKFTRKWTFQPNLPGTLLDKEAMGPVYTVQEGDQTRMYYATKGGAGVCFTPGNTRPLIAPFSMSSESLRVPAGFARLSLMFDKPFFLVPDGKRLRAFDVEKGSQLWGQGSEEMPAVITTTPILLPGTSEILVGCEDGNLYAIAVKDGKRVRDGGREKMWFGKTGNAVRGTPLLTDRYLLAGTNDGTLYAFEHRGGSDVATIGLGGSILAPMAVQRQLLFFGTQTNDAFYVVDAARMSIRYSQTKDKVSGGVTQGALVVGDRVYFGTEAGYFYALEKTEEAYEVSWTFRDPSNSRVIGPPVLLPNNRVVFVCGNGKVYAFDE
ncbi:MAG: PQQ-binding-like beta-propeller repeat protein [Planctomycetota bacterium]|nr:PQQ-binding-like beta-propeller repeat protein [Planctomycetota bacterium]